MAIVEIQRKDTPQIEVPMKSVEKTAKVLTGSYVWEAFCGAAMVVLTIIGLAGAAPVTLAAVAGLILGTAFLYNGGSILSQLNRIVAGASVATRARFEAGSLMLSAAGLAGIVLSIIALGGGAPVILVAVANIVFGLALAVAGVGTYSIDLALPWREERTIETLPGSDAAMAGFEGLAGLTSVVLGVIALAGGAPIMLDLVALLVVGSAITLGGTLSSVRFMKHF